MVKWFIAFITAFFWFLLDRITKLWVLKNIAGKGVIRVNDFLNIVYVTNKGGLWGIGNHRGSGFFIFASIVAIFVILAFLKKITSEKRLVSFSLGLILGGGIGNLVDRFAYGKVIDFIDFHYKSWHWPAFNVADLGITIGIVLLVLFYGSGRGK